MTAKAANLYLSDATREGLRVYAHQTGRSMSKAADRIISAFLADRARAQAKPVSQAESTITMDRIAAICREQGAEVAFQELLRQAGAGLNPERKPL